MTEVKNQQTGICPNCGYAPVFSIPTPETTIYMPALLEFYEWCYKNLSYPTKRLRSECEHQMKIVAHSLGKLKSYFPGETESFKPFDD